MGEYMEEICVIGRIVDGAERVRRVIRLWLAHCAASSYEIQPSFGVFLAEDGEDGTGRYRILTGSHHARGLDECIGEVKWRELQK